MEKLFDINLEAMKNFQAESKTEVCEKHGEYESTSFSPFGKRILWTTCPACAEEEDRNRRDEEAQRNREIEKRQLEGKLKEFAAPKRYWGLNLENFNPTNDQNKAFVDSKKFVENFSADNSQVLILCGTVGTGKTRLASAIIQELDFGYYIRAIDISRKVRASYSTNEYSEVDVIDHFVDQNLLVIDEVGVQSGTENETLLITDIIDRRYAELKSTVLVSNLNKDKLAEVFGQRAWDRIRQDAMYQPMTGQSLRG